MPTRQYTIVPASTVLTEELNTFYDEYFGHTQIEFKKWWKWHNRIEYFEDKRIPLVMLDGEKVIAHAGMRPFTIEIDEERFEAAWYIDFMVHKDYRRQGLGSLITKEFIKLSQISFAVTGNEKSMGAFRKLGWSESTSSHLHYFLFKPFDHHRFHKFPGLIKLIGNRFSRILWNMKYSRYSINHCEVIKLTEDTIHLIKHKEKLKQTWTPSRNKNFWYWRLIESPYLVNYYLFGKENDYIVYKKYKENENDIIELMYMDMNFPKQALINKMGVFLKWALKEKVSHVRLYVTEDKVSQLFKNKFYSLISKQEFAFIANDKKIETKLEKSRKWDFQFVDNDFEIL